MAGAVEAWQSTARGKVRFQLILSRKGTGVTLAVKRDLGRGFRAIQKETIRTEGLGRQRVATLMRTIVEGRDP